jgi:hypothetical protein
MGWRRHANCGAYVRGAELLRTLRSPYIALILRDIPRNQCRIITARQCRIIFALPPPTGIPPEAVFHTMKGKEMTVCCAKFVRTAKIIRPSSQEGFDKDAEPHFHAVCSQFDPDGNNASEENRIFGKWTPNASLTMIIRNKSTFD